MGYSTGSLAQGVAEIAIRVQARLDLVGGGFPDGDAQSTATEIVSITKSIDSIRADLQTAAKVLRRGASILLTLQDLGRSTGRVADPVAFIATCTAAELDQLVALRKADCAGGVAFYLECHAKASTYKTNT